MAFDSNLVQCYRNAIDTYFTHKTKKDSAHYDLNIYIKFEQTIGNITIVENHLVSMEPKIHGALCKCSSDSFLVPVVPPPGTSGFFCKCDANNHVSATPVAYGSTDVDVFNQQLLTCLYDGLPLSINHYYTPTGLPGDCVYIEPDLRITECTQALFGSVTHC